MPKTQAHVDNGNDILHTCTNKEDDVSEKVVCLRLLKINLIYPVLLHPLRKQIDGSCGVNDILMFMTF